MNLYKIFTKLLNLGYDRFSFSGDWLNCQPITCELKKPGNAKPSIVAVGASKLHALRLALKMAQEQNQ